MSSLDLDCPEFHKVNAKKHLLCPQLDYVQLLIIQNARMGINLSSLSLRTMPANGPYRLKISQYYAATLFGGVAQWLGFRSLAGGPSLIYG